MLPRGATNISTAAAFSSRRLKDLSALLMFLSGAVILAILNQE